ncbi:MAG: S49 family peptidase [Anaerolineales bacterium]|nr:S49 family peptidase [Anaerolineales bacterium]
MTGRVIKSIFLLIVVVMLPLGLGFILAPQLVPRPQVGVIYLYGDIDVYSALLFEEQLDYARINPDVKAVAIVIDSPGGEVSASEDLYFNVLHTREYVPVIVSVDWMAASGAYYVAAAADEIYAKPTSLVGNIGVIGYAYSPPYVEEEVLTTGPYKAFGGTQAGRVQQMEIAKESFLAAVSAGRGKKLDASLDYLSRGEIFSGVQSLQMGLIDGLSSTDEAIARAAELAGLRDYEVVDLWSLAFADELALYEEDQALKSSINYSSLYYLYVELPD